MLKVTQLTKTYRKSHLGRTRTTPGVTDLNLEIQDGEIFSLIGPNGAGKTTTLKLILGLLFPDQGSIELKGKRLPDPAAIASVGFLPEVPYFPANFTVEEVLHFYGKLSGISPSQISKKVEAALETVRMTQRKEKKVRECSKGMLQRLSLAQALIHDPQFLVLDEPITGLDPMGLTEMREMIINLNKKGKTILFSSHIIAEVEKIAHRVGIMVGGKMVQILSRKEWESKPGRLEEIFVAAVKEHGGAEIYS